MAIGSLTNQTPSNFNTVIQLVLTVLEIQMAIAHLRTRIAIPHGDLCKTYT